MKKIYLTESKNITGNAINDEELLEFAKLEETDFNKKIKSLYLEKKIQELKF